MRKYLIAALAAGTLATPAFAQDQGLGGFRIEGVGGYDRPSVEDENASGVVYGLGVGYDVQSGNAVFGVEAEATDSTADERVAGFAITGDELRVRAGRDLYVGGRAGAVVGGSTLLYAKAGYTNARSRDMRRQRRQRCRFSDRTNLDGVRRRRRAIRDRRQRLSEDGVSLLQLSGRRRPPPGRRRLRLPLLTRSGERRGPGASAPGPFSWH